MHLGTSYAVVPVVSWYRWCRGTGGSVVPWYPWCHATRGAVLPVVPCYPWCHATRGAMTLCGGTVVRYHRVTEHEGSKFRRPSSFLLRPRNWKREKNSLKAGRK
ncbi:hypothetical protein ACFE04_026068 [Oxalis oulophora]